MEPLDNQSEFLVLLDDEHATEQVLSVLASTCVSLPSTACVPLSQVFLADEVLSHWYVASLTFNGALPGDTSGRSIMPSSNVTFADEELQSVTTRPLPPAATELDSLFDSSTGNPGTWDTSTPPTAPTGLEDLGLC